MLNTDVSASPLASRSDSTRTRLTAATMAPAASALSWLTISRVCSSRQALPSFVAKFMPRGLKA
jgi:hypothetical protein